MMNTEQQPPLPAFKAAVEELREFGITLTMSPGEYKVNYRNGTPATAYCSDDLADAVEHGRALGLLQPASSEPPLGPMRRSGSRRGKMYRHNATFRLEITNAV
ncbi:MAG: hypothetical protein WDO70_07970 [Alphaproteobacteria bacterium]